MSGSPPPAAVGGTKEGSIQRVSWKGVFLGVKKDNGKLSQGLAYQTYLLDYLSLAL
jgi:hypothetical protein